MFKWFRNAITEKDNSTHCPVRISGVVGIIVYHVLAVIGFFMHQLTLDINALGQYTSHMMTLGGTLSAGIAIKSVSKGDSE